MPELPEVETTKTSLRPLLGKTVQSVQLFQPKLRWAIPDDLNRLVGYRLTKVTRRAKYLILTFCLDNTHLPDDHTDAQAATAQSAMACKSLIIHLGMSGSLQQFVPNTAKRKHDHLIIHFANEDYDFYDCHIKELTAHTADIQLHYHDPRRFGAVVWFDDYADKLFNHLGIEPLEDQFTGNYLYQSIQRTKANLASPANHTNKRQTKLNNNTKGNNNAKGNKPRPITRAIKSVIMDQAIVVGVGNIYATESLFLAGIHPSTPAHLIEQDKLDLLVTHIKAILATAIDKGGSTLRDFSVASGTTGYFQQTLNVYGKYKEPCPICKTQIDKVSINGRASTFCPACQKRD